MNHPFKNTAAPAYFVNWAVRNLNITSDTELLTDTANKNIREYADHDQKDEIKQLFIHFKTELHTHSHDEMVGHYASLAHAPAVAV